MIGKFSLQPSPSKWAGRTSHLHTVRIYGLKREKGELFKEGFRKLFKLEQNHLYETQLEILLAKI